MFFAIFSVAFLIVAGLAFLFGALKGKRKRWQVSLSRIIFTIAAALLSTCAALLICWIVLKTILGNLITTGTLGEVGGLLTEVPSMQLAALAFVSMIVAPLLFLIFFAILRPVLSAFTKPLARLMTKKADKEEVHYKDNGKVDKNACLKLPKANVASVLLGGFSGILLLCILLVPLVGFTGVAADIGASALNEATDNDPMVSEAITALDTNVGAVTVKALGGGLLYDLMTSYPTESGMATLRHEGEFIGSAATAAVSLTDEAAEKQEQIDSLHEANTAFNDSTLLPTVLAELVSAAADSWKDGKDYHGIECPELGGDDFEPVVMSLIDGLANSTTDTIKVDLATIIDVFCAVIENDVLDKMDGDPLAILSEEEFTSQLLLSLLNNPRFEVAVDGISDFGLEMLMEGVGAKANKDGLYASMMLELDAVSGDDEKALKKAYTDVFDKYGIRVDKTQIDMIVQNKLQQTRSSEISNYVSTYIVSSEFDFKQKTELVSTDMLTDGKAVIDDKEAEAKALAHAYAVMYSMLDDIEGDVSTQEILGKLGPALDSFSATQTIGKERTAYILIALLQSEDVRTNIGLSLLAATDNAQAIVEGAGNKQYDGMLNSLAKMVDMVEMVSNASTSTKESEEAVKTLLEDLSPESAKVIQTMATPEVMINYGVAEKSAEPTANVVSNTFGNLADAKDDMSDEEYEKESAAVNDMMTIMMAANESDGSKPTFGEDSTTGKDAKEIIDSVMDSTVMSKTLIEEVYADGEEAKTDPLNSERQLNESEQDEFMSAVNESWAENANDPEAEKKLTAIGAFVNMEIKLVDGAWVVA